MDQHKHLGNVLKSRKDENYIYTNTRNVIAVSDRNPNYAQLSAVLCTWALDRCLGAELLLFRNTKFRSILWLV